SFPLMQEVVEDLHFDVSMFREGDIKTTEYYDPDFPVDILVVPGSKRAGRPIYFTITSESTFDLTYEGLEDQNEPAKSFKNMSFNDTVRINGYSLYFRKKTSVHDFIGVNLLVTFQDPFSVAKAYSGKLSVTWAQPGSSVVDLEIRGPIQRKGIDFLNRFIERYQVYDVEKKTRESKMAISFLDRQLQVIGDSLRQFEDQVERFKKRNLITDLQTESDRLYQKLTGYEEQNFKFSLSENYFQYVEGLLSNDNYAGIFTPNSVGIDDPILAELITQLLEEQAQVNLYKTNADRGVDKSLENPALMSKVQRINYIKKDIGKAIENARTTQRINQKFIQEQVRLLEEQLRKMPSTERELVDIQRNYHLRETLYVFLLQKRAEAGLSEASTTSDIVVVNPPVAGASISPKSTQNYGIALGFGLLLPLIAFVLAEWINDRVQSREDIEQVTNVSIIGGIGHNPSADPMVIFSRPKSAMAESFRALRSNLSYFTSGKDHQVFMVTSSIPGEGKSFATLNLASVFSLAGKKTLVIGADLRKPKLFDELNLKNEKGLSQYLSGMATLEEIIQPSVHENLYLIAGGVTPPNPSELLLKPEMGSLLRLLREQFNYVILDTPPLALIADAFVLAAHADHTLFMVRQDYTPRSVLQALQEYYASGKVSKVSIVFNDLRKKGMGYGYHGYGYDYGYGSRSRGQNDEGSYYS
ncbi:MAG: polysaccharide biosynthesis tyrosine autokinase, partial [Bacteroidota bacterium]